MKADEARQITASSIEDNNLANNTKISEMYNGVIKTILNESKYGRRSIVLHMSKIHYSIIHRLLCDGYYIEDSGAAGDCIVSW